MREEPTWSQQKAINDENVGIPMEHATRRCPVASLWLVQLAMASPICSTSQDSLKPPPPSSPRPRRELGHEQLSRFQRHQGGFNALVWICHGPLRSWLLRALRSVQCDLMTECTGAVKRNPAKRQRMLCCVRFQSAKIGLKSAQLSVGNVQLGFSSVQALAQTMYWKFRIWRQK